MDKYKINIIYNTDKNNDINMIFVNSITKDLNKYLSSMICKNKKNNLLSNCTYLSLQKGGTSEYREFK